MTSPLLRPALSAGPFGVTSPIERAVGVLELELLGQRRREVLDHDAEVAAGDLAVFDEALHHVAGEVDGNGEADALVAAAAAEDGGVDADQPAVGVHERAAGVAGIDGGVGLDEILVVQCPCCRGPWR